MVKAVGGFLFLFLLAATSVARADEIEVGWCTGLVTSFFGLVPCYPTGGAAYANVTGSTPITDPLPANQSGTDPFSWSMGVLSLTGTIDAGSQLSGVGLNGSLNEGLSITATATDSTWVVGTIELIVQQNITTPAVAGFGLLTGQSVLNGSCSSNTAGSITATTQVGGYPLGNFDSVACSTAPGFNLTGNGIIPTYAADGYFYDQIDFNFSATGVSESMTLPLSGNLPVPDPQPVTTTPEPPAGLLLATGLLGLLGLRFGRSGLHRTRS